RPDVSPRLDAAVDRALAKDPAHRFPSMTAFAGELRACLAENAGDVPPMADAELTLITPPARAQTPPPARPRRRRRRRRRLAWVLLALVVVGAAFAAVVLLGGGGGHHGGAPGGGGSTGAAVQLQGVGNTYSNPLHPDTHADTAPMATDGSAATYW